MGGDFTYQDAGIWYHNLDKLIEYTNLKSAQEGLNVKLFYSTPSCYLKAVQEANPTLPTKQDDFFPYASDPNSFWTGYFTSRPTTKYFEREANSYLQMVKQLQVLANLEAHNQFVVDELKSAMGIMQHHDAITGTEKQHVTHDYERILDVAVDDALIVARQALNKYLQGDPLKPPLLQFDRCRFNESSCYTTEHSDQFVIAVYNHLAWDVSEAIRVPVMEGNYDVYAPNGEIITSQLVDIPAAVQAIPTRKSEATHEIFFIAELHPVSYKTFYVRKTNRRRRSTSDSKKRNEYSNINEFWNNINAPTEDAKLFEISLLDDVDDGIKEIDRLIQIINEQKKKHTPERLLMDEDEMSMQGDDPSVVSIYPEVTYLENEHIKLSINPNGEVTHLIRNDGTDIQFGIQFSYYPGTVGNNEVFSNRSSGAYIFRPNATHSVFLNFNTSDGPSGPVVKELRMNVDDNVHNTIRLYNGLNFLETEWVVGPIDISDNVGKEFVVKYVTDLVNNGEFYTDSNGRQSLKRKLNKRPQFNLTLEEPVAGNYYPITNKIHINSEKHKLAVLTDRAQGGTSLSEGEVEIMLHRRLLHDDAFGVGEALDEVANGKGLVVRGRHRLFLSEADSKADRMEETKQVLQFHLQPVVLVADATTFSQQEWLQLPSKAFSWAQSLPKGVHLLTVEPWGEKALLLRLENYLEIGDQDNTTVEVNLGAIFKSLTVKQVRETMLAGNIWTDEKKTWSWNKENSFSLSFNDEYGEVNEGGISNDEVENIRDDGLLVRVKAKQIRTFVVYFDYN